jgi:hypothetical protein
VFTRSVSETLKREGGTTLYPGVWCNLHWH